MRKTKTLLMMAIALLFSGAAFAQMFPIGLISYSGDGISALQPGVAAEDHQNPGQGIYQQYTVVFDEDFVDAFAGKDKVVTLTYVEKNVADRGRKYEEKVENIINEDVEDPVTSVNFVLDYLLPNVEYTVTAEVSVLGYRSFTKTATFKSYLGDLAELGDVISLHLGQDNAKVTLNTEGIVTVSGEKVDLTQATITVKLTCDGTTKTLTAGDNGYYWENTADAQFLKAGKPVVATVEVKYNNVTKSKSTNGKDVFGQLDINPLWVYVEHVGPGVNDCDIIVKGMTGITQEVSAIAELYLWIDGETAPEHYTIHKSNLQDVAEGENFHFTAADLKAVKSNIFSNKNNKGFYFKMVVVTTASQTEDVVWTLNECHAVLTEPTWPYPYDFVPLWNNGQPTLASSTITAAKQVEVIDYVNQLVADHIWDPTDASTAETTYSLDITGAINYVSFWRTAGADPANDVALANGTVTVTTTGTGDDAGWYEVTVGDDIAPDGATAAQVAAFVGEKFWVYCEDINTLAVANPAKLQLNTLVPGEEVPNPDYDAPDGKAVLVEGIPIYPGDDGYEEAYQNAQPDEIVDFWADEATQYTIVDPNPAGTPATITTPDTREATNYWIQVVPASATSDPVDFPETIAYKQTGILADDAVASEKYSVPTLEGAEASDAANTVTWDLAGTYTEASAKISGTVTVDWEYYLIYEKHKNYTFYPNVVEPNIYTQEFNNALFADWAKTPKDGVLDIQNVRVLYDGDAAKANTVEVTFPKVYNDGSKINKLYVRVFVKSQSQGAYFMFNCVSGADAVEVTVPAQADNNDIKWTTEIPVDVEGIVRRDWQTYYDVRVVIYGDDNRDYKAIDSDVFSTFNRRGVMTVEDLDQVISITNQKLNIDPVLSLTGFEGDYKITGKLIECDEEGNPVEDGQVLEPSLVRQAGEDPTGTGLYSETVIEEQGYVFANVKEETWYKAEFTFEYVAIRDRLDGTEVKRDTMYIKGAVEFAEGVDNPFKTIKVPAEGFIEIHTPKYYLQETEGDIIARLRIWTGKDEAAPLFVKVDGFDEPFAATGTEENTVTVWEVPEGHHMARPHEEVRTYQTFDIPLHVDLDAFTPEVPATWNLGYQAYIQDEATGTVTANKVVEEYDRRAINTPLPYVQFMNPAPAYFYYDEVFKGPAASYYGIDLPRFGYTYPSRADFRAMVEDNELAEFMSLLIPNLSAWDAAEWSAEYLHNNFAYTRAAVPGFENASDPKFFGAPNLVYRADIQDPAAALLYSDPDYEEGNLLTGDLGLGIKWWVEPDGEVFGWSSSYGVFEEFSPFFQVDENGNPVHNYVTVMPLDPKKAEAVKLMLKWDEYYNALQQTGEWMSYSNVSGHHAHAFSVVLNDAKRGAAVEENYSYFNLLMFSADDALYTGVFPSRNRTVVIPFTGKAYTDAEYTTDATVRYFSAGYLDEDNEVVFRFSKKLRNGEASNELTAGYPYMVNAGSDVSYADVYFHAEDAEMLPSLYTERYDYSIYGYPDGIEDVETGLYINGYSTEVYMWGTYDLTYDFDYWYENVEDDGYWKMLRQFAAFILGKEEITEEEFFDNMPFYLRPAYEQYKQYALFRFSSLDNFFWELERTSIPQYDEETGDLLPGDYDFIKPFQCALYFRGAHNPNAGYSIGVRFDDDATVIESAPVIENVSGDIYDVMGRKISEPVKGQIYIQNGKKFMAE